MIPACSLWFFHSSASYTLCFNHTLLNLCLQADFCKSLPPMIPIAMMPSVVCFLFALFLGPKVTVPLINLAAWMSGTCFDLELVVGASQRNFL